jgi:hypothetical protein
VNKPSRHKLTRATPRISVVDHGWEWERGGVVSAPLAIVLGDPDEGYVVIEGTHDELAAMLHSMALHLGPR